MCYTANLNEASETISSQSLLQLLSQLHGKAHWENRRIYEWAHNYDPVFRNLCDADLSDSEKSWKKV